ncbi:serine hydrolase [Mangrovicoccus ximenensis]|uniref:serine hydrolase n=1 Tax=Mangrovicoccus ximenensis TaxID=1911570 RepID=UPI00191C24CB|nr:serine hydrolase [Mangrovicoccus ximenensis]
MNWTSPVRDFLPWFDLGDDWVSGHVTIGDLYAHRSGLPDHAGDDLEDIGYGRREVLERLGKLPQGPFRAQYAYTNFGLTAAAEAVATAAGTDWAALSEEAIYKPLGMTSTSSRHADYMGRANRAAGHVPGEGGYEAADLRQPDAQSAAGEPREPLLGLRHRRRGQEQCQGRAGEETERCHCCGPCKNWRPSPGARGDS